MNPGDGALASDRARQIFTVAAAVAQAALPTVLVPRFTPDLQPSDVIQPAPYAFSMWVPIFGSSLAYAVAQTHPTWARDPALREAGWPLAAAFAGIGAWAPLVGRSRFWASEGSLLSSAVLAEHARRKLARSDQAGLMRSQRNLALTPASLLSAWSAAASIVQLASMVVTPQPGRRSWPTAPTAEGAAIAVSVLATTATIMTPGGRRTRAARIYAGTTAWGLVGIVIGQRQRKPATAALAALGAATVISATI